MFGTDVEWHPVMKTSNEVRLAIAAPLLFALGCQISVPSETGQTESRNSTRVQFEDYNQGGEGVGYHDGDAQNAGGQYRPSEGVDIEARANPDGYNIGWVQDGEWLKYDVTVPVDGMYELTARIAVSPAAGMRFVVDVDNGSHSLWLDATDGAGLDSYQLISMGTVSLTAGNHGLTFSAAGGSWASNLDYMELTPVADGDGGGDGRYHVRTDGTIVDGRGAAFFGYGFFTNHHQTADIKNDINIIGAAGFNVLFVEPNDNAGIVELLDEAAKYPKLRIVWSSIKGAGGSNLPQIYGLMPNIADKSALLAYGIADDVHSGSPLGGWPASLDDVLMLHNEFKQRDPKHLTFAALGNGPDKVFDTQRFDIAGQEIYPVNGGSPINLVYEYTQSCVNQAAPYPLSPWTLTQTFNWGGANQRDVNASEYYNMIYQSVVGGAKGLMNFTFVERETDEPLNTRVPAVWQESIATIGEIAAIATFLTDGQFTKYDLGDGLYAATWELGGSGLAIISHAGRYGTTLDPRQNSPDTRNVSLPLPAGFVGPAMSPFIGRPTGMTVIDGKLTGSVSLLDVHIYTFGPAVTPSPR
jgi:Carbohydrate binding module (family 6)